jgi:cell wall-associated NlpC family hydrolase
VTLAVRTTPRPQGAARGDGEKYSGVRYVWGGASPSTGFDCSGFVNYVYASCGLSVKRTSSLLYSESAKISKSELQPGDLVFFASPSGWYVSHVGIYMGAGQFIHASSGAAA